MADAGPRSCGTAVAGRPARAGPLPACVPPLSPDGELGAPYPRLSTPAARQAESLRVLYERELSQRAGGGGGGGGGGGVVGSGGGGGGYAGAADHDDIYE
jgi:hypothetical protein